MFDINHEIARHICLAQIASDAGKGKFRLEIGGKAAQNAALEGYWVKDDHIAKAIELINSTKSCFNYYCERRRDQNGHLSSIIYFSFKAEGGKRYQVSFHSFAGNNKNTIIRWSAERRMGSQVHWDHKDSFGACCALKEYYRL